MAAIALLSLAPRTAALAQRGAVPSPLVQLVDIKLGRGGPSTIDPCWLVNRGLYNAAQHGVPLAVEFTFTYLSRGERVTKTFVVDLARGIPEDENVELRGNNFIELTIPLDASDAPPDEHADIAGSVVLIRSLDGMRS